MDKLSVTVITFNEEKNIRGCLESVRWADELVVVDSGSSDSTLDICREYTDRLFTEAWRGYGRQKNLAADKAANPWILNIDADERVTKGLKQEIEGLFEKGTELDGFYMPRKSFFLGKWIKHGGWYPDYNLRLFKKGKGRFVERDVHETVELDGRAGYLKKPIEHYTYNSISDYLLRMDRYSTLAAGELKKKGRSINISDIIIRPHATFLKMYILKKGFLDGYRGLILSALYSAYTLSKYIKLWEMEGKDGAS